MSYRLNFYILVIILFSCKNRAPVTTIRDTTKIVAKDTVSGSDESDYPQKYIEHARLEGKDQVITLTSRYAVVDGKVDEECHYAASHNYFVHIDKKTGKADTVEAGLDNLGGCIGGCQFIKPRLKISTTPTRLSASKTANSMNFFRLWIPKKRGYNSIGLARSSWDSWWGGTR